MPGTLQKTWREELTLNNSPPNCSRWELIRTRFNLEIAVALLGQRGLIAAVQLKIKE